MSVVRAFVFLIVFAAGSRILAAETASHTAATSTNPLGSRKEPISSDKPIEVKGQARNTSLLNMGGDKLQIKFIKLRKNYNEEILDTEY